MLPRSWLPWYRYTLQCLAAGSCADRNIQGPYLPNYYHRDPFSLPKAEQSSKLFNLLNVDIIRNTILGWVLRDHFDGANFAISCRTAFFLLAGQIVSTGSILIRTLS